MDKCIVDMKKVINDLKLVKRTKNEEGEKIESKANSCDHIWVLQIQTFIKRRMEASVTYD